MITHNCHWLMILICANPLTLRAAVFGEATAGGEPPDPPASTRPAEPWQRALTGDDAVKVEAMNTQIVELRRQGKYAEALPLARESLEIRQRVQGDDHWETIDARWVVRTIEHAISLSPQAQSELTWTYEADSQIEDLNNHGKYDEALALAQRVLDARQRVVGAQHPDLALSQSNLARTLYYKGDYATAQSLHGEVLALRRKLLGNDHPNVTVSLSDLALIMQTQGDYQTAQLLYRQAITISGKVLGEQHSLNLYYKHNLAFLLNATGNYPVAEALFREVLAATRSDPGLQGLRDSAMNNLAMLLTDKGDFAEAESLYRESLEAFLKSVNLYGVATTLDSLSTLLQEKGDWIGAEPLCREALSLRRRILGDNHPNIATNLNNLAHLQVARGEYVMAEYSFQQALQIFDQLGQEDQGDPPPAPAIESGLQADSAEKGKAVDPARAAAIDENGLRGCTRDQYENNDSFPQATALGCIGFWFGADLSIETNDPDYYRFDVISATGYIQTGINQAQGSVGMCLYDSAYQQLACTQGTSDIYWQVTGPGQYYLRVYAITGCVPYYDFFISTPASDYPAIRVEPPSLQIYCNGLNDGACQEGLAAAPDHLPAEDDFEVVADAAAWDTPDAAAPTDWLPPDAPEWMCAALADRGRAHEISAANGVEWCRTEARLREAPADNPEGGLRAAAVCPREGLCDNPSARDRWTPNPTAPFTSIHLVFNIFANDDGSGPAATWAAANAQLAQINADFAPARIQFAAVVRVINSSQYRSFADWEEVGMKTAYASQSNRRINVYVVNIEGGYFGVSTFPWDPDALGSLGGVVIDDNWFGAAQRVLTHELGHCLGLWHTHRGVSEVTACGPCYERADGTSGDTTGDFCSDTPSTPVNYFCAAPGGTDPCSNVSWGATQPQNYMSFAPTWCWTQFTPQQMGRMHCWIVSELTCLTGRGLTIYNDGCQSLCINSITLPWWMSLGPLIHSICPIGSGGAGVQLGLEADCGACSNANLSGSVTIFSNSAGANPYTVPVQLTCIPCQIDLDQPDGGHTLCRSSRFTIQWNSGGAGGNVRIELLKGGSVVQTIAADAPDSGLHTWLVNPSSPDGSDYRIRIGDAANPACSDASDHPFTVTTCTSTPHDLLVSSFNTDRVLRYNGQTGEFIETLVHNTSGSLLGATGLAWRNDGLLYVGSFFNHHVPRYDLATGAWADSFVTALAGGLSMPNEVLFGPNGDLYVSSQGAGQVLLYDGVTGAFNRVFTSGVPLSAPQGMVFGPDGHLYVSSAGNDRILRYDGQTGAFMDEFVTAGACGLNMPFGVAFGPDGHLYVCSELANQVLRYNGSTGACMGVFAAGGGLNQPQDLAFGPDGNLYVSSLNTDSVLRYNGQTGAFMNVFIPAGSGDLSGPTWLLFVPVIADCNGNGVPDDAELGEPLMEFADPISGNPAAWPPSTIPPADKSRADLAGPIGCPRRTNDRNGNCLPDDCE